MASSRFKSCGHPHAEGFCLMRYASKAGDVITVWNARNGVTPFGFSHGGVEYTHIQWRNDRRTPPSFAPALGTLAFVNLTLERAREHRTRYVALHWDNPDYPMSEHYESKEAAIEKLAQGDVAGPQAVVANPADVEECHPPDLVEVDAAFLAELWATRAEASKP